MRLLNTLTGNFEEFQDHSTIPSYAILSHTWSPEGEQTFQEVRTVQEGFKQGSVKLKISSPTPHSIPLPAMQRDGLLQPHTSNAVTSVSTVETAIGRIDRSSEGVFTLMLAWIALTLLARLVCPTGATSEQRA